MVYYNLQHQAIIFVCIVNVHINPRNITNVINNSLEKMYVNVLKNPRDNVNSSLFLHNKINFSFTIFMDNCFIKWNKTNPSLDIRHMEICSR